MPSHCSSPFSNKYIEVQKFRFLNLVSAFEYVYILILSLSSSFLNPFHSRKYRFSEVLFKKFYSVMLHHLNFTDF